MESQEELWVVSCLQHAPFEIYVEIVDVFILLKNILQKNLITDKEHRVIFNPTRTINKSLNSINREMNKAAEEFYQANKSDYELESLFCIKRNNIPEGKNSNTSCRRKCCSYVD